MLSVRTKYNLFYYRSLHAYTEKSSRTDLTKYQTYDHNSQTKVNNLQDSLCLLGQKGFTVDHHLRLYKVTSLSQSEVEKLQRGNIYKPNRFFSTSRGKNHLLHETDYFISGRPEDKNKIKTFFVIEQSGRFAVDIQHFSKYKKEKEALFLPSSQFKINEIKQNGDFLQVYMQCIGN